MAKLWTPSTALLRLIETAGRSATAEQRRSACYDALRTAVGTDYSVLVYNNAAEVLEAVYEAFLAFSPDGGITLPDPVTITPQAYTLPGTSPTGKILSSSDATIYLTTTSVGASGGAGFAIELDANLDGTSVVTVSGGVEWPTGFGVAPSPTPAPAPAPAPAALDESLLHVSLDPTVAFPYTSPPSRRDYEIEHIRYPSTRFKLQYCGVYNVSYNPGTIGSASGTGAHSDGYHRMLRTTFPGIARSAFQLRLRAIDELTWESATASLRNEFTPSWDTQAGGFRANWLKNGRSYYIGLAKTRLVGNWTSSPYNEITLWELHGNDGNPAALELSSLVDKTLILTRRTAPETSVVVSLGAASSDTVPDYFIIELTLGNAAQGNSPSLKLHRAFGLTGSLEEVTAAASSAANNFAPADDIFYAKNGIYAWAGDYQKSGFPAEGLVYYDGGMYIVDRANYPACTKEMLLAHMRSRGA